MKNKILIISVLIFLSSLCYAEEETKKTIEIDEAIIKKGITCYGASLKSIISTAERNLKKVTKQLEKNKREESIEKHLGKGHTLFKEEKFKDAKKEFEEALRLGGRQSIKKYITKSEKMDRQKARELKSQKFVPKRKD